MDRPLEALIIGGRTSEFLNGNIMNKSMEAVEPLGAPEHDDDYPFLSLYEVVHVMRKLNSNRAAGDDQLSGEFF